MRGAYGETLAFISASLPAMLAFAILLKNACWLLPCHFGPLLSFLAKCIMAYCIHRAVLFDKPLCFPAVRSTQGAPQIGLLWFVPVCVALVVVPIMLALLLAALVS